MHTLRRPWLLLAVLLLGSCAAPASARPAGEPQVEQIAIATATPRPTRSAETRPTASPDHEPVVAIELLATVVPLSPLAPPADAAEAEGVETDPPPTLERVPLTFPTATPTERASGTPAPALEFPSAATAEAQLALADLLSATVPTALPVSAAMAAALTAVAPEKNVETPPAAPSQSEEGPPSDAVDAPPQAITEIAAPQTEPPAETPAPPASTAATLAPDGVERTARVPILMYHYLSVPPGDADIYRRDLSVAPDLFAAHLDRLRAEGYTTIRLYDLMAHLWQGAPLPEKPVILTFDDGYRDNYENAFPLLHERGMTATFFVVSDFIDEQRPEYLTWEMAREMLAGGMSIEAHGRNHVSLAAKEEDYLIWQALGSLETIQHELGQRPRFFSYPAGEYDERTIEIIRSANYWGAVTTQQGATHAGDNSFELLRVRVRGTTTPDDLAKLLAADW